MSKPRCLQCNRPLGPEAILGPVCGYCTRLNHLRAVRSADVEKPRRPAPPKRRRRPHY